MISIIRAIEITPCASQGLSVLLKSCSKFNVLFLIASSMPKDGAFYIFIAKCNSESSETGEVDSIHYLLVR